MANKTSFGFKKVTENVKAKLVKDVFSSVAKKYDLMNDLMSFGIHRLWKDKLINKIKLKDNLNIIDMAGGTGDIAFRLYKKLNNHYDKFDIVVADCSEDMIEEGKRRAIDQNIIDARISWQVEDGEQSSFKNGEFDVYTIAYGIRNFANIENGLQEAYRILKSGGQFLCLEFSAVDNVLLKKFYDFYSFKVIPRIGKLVTDDSSSYQYFVESIRMFPKPDQFVEMIREAGFKQVEVVNLTGGITSLYSARK